MTELQPSSTVYHIEKTDRIITVRCDKPIKVQDSIFDNLNQQWIFAVHCEDGQGLYHIDYLYANADFTLTKVLAEDRGVLPAFLQATDSMIWVRLDSTGTEREGESVLPMENRSRITKEILRKSVGWQKKISVHGQQCVFYTDYFDRRKPDKLFHYQFDKKHLYKTRKQYSLENIHSGHPKTIQDTCYITYGKWADSLCTVHIAEIDETGSILSDWQSDPVTDVWDVYLESRSDAQISCIIYAKHCIERIVFHADGTLLSRTELFRTDLRINYIDVQEHGICFVIAPEQGPPAGKNCILFPDIPSAPCYAFDNGYAPQGLNSRYFILNPIRNDKCDFRIVSVQNT